MLSVQTGVGKKPLTSAERAHPDTPLFFLDTIAYLPYTMVMITVPWWIRFLSWLRAGRQYRDDPVAPVVLEEDDD